MADTITLADGSAKTDENPILVRTQTVEITESWSVEDIKNQIRQYEACMERDRLKVEELTNFLNSAVDTLKLPTDLKV